MEDIEITSWLILDAIKDVGEVVEEVGDLQTGHWKSLFCIVEDDHHGEVFWKAYYKHAPYGMPIAEKF